MLDVLIKLVCYFCFGYVCYRIGHEHGFVDGRKNTIHALFYGEKDFKRYLDYRRKRMGDGNEG